MVTYRVITHTHLVFTLEKAPLRYIPWFVVVDYEVGNEVRFVTLHASHGTSHTVPAALWYWNQASYAFKTGSAEKLSGSRDVDSIQRKLISG